MNIYDLGVCWYYPSYDGKYKVWHTRKYIYIQKFDSDSLRSKRCTACRHSHSFYAIEKYRLVRKHSDSLRVRVCSSKHSGFGESNN